jgi:hypothetical protein
LNKQLSEYEAGVPTNWIIMLSVRLMMDFLILVELVSIFHEYFVQTK